MGLPEHTAASLAAVEKVKMATYKYRMSFCKIEVWLQHI